jgi:tetratricopeptide (TPR) repeat protein
LVAALRRAGITAQLPSGPTPSEARRWQTLAHRDRAAKAFLLGRDEEAAKELRSLTELQPGSEDAWLLLAEFLLKTSQPAGDAINSALRAGKYSPALHARAARLCLENSAEPKTALEQARAAVRKSPDSPEYLALVGWACLQNDMLDEAKQNLEKALRLNARYAHARYLMGQVFEKEGKQDDALRDYRVALNLDPSLQEAKEAIDRLTAGGR